MTMQRRWPGVLYVLGPYMRHMALFHAANDWGMFLSMRSFAEVYQYVGVKRTELRASATANRRTVHV